MDHDSDHRTPFSSPGEDEAIWRNAQDDPNPNSNLMRPRPRRRGFFARLWFSFLWFCALMCLLGILAGVGVIYFYGWLAGKFDLSQVGRMPERTIIYDVRGNEIGRLHGENRVVVTLEDVSPHVIEALLAREDTRFYQHHGIDYLGLVRALLRNVQDMDSTQGASTITMQLARNSFSLTEKTMHRKLLEAMLAYRIENVYRKGAILEHYLNRVYFGSGIYGLERAAKAYFGVSSKNLTKGQAAMLVGILRGPNRLSPFRHPDDAHDVRNETIDRLIAMGRMTPGEGELIKAERERILPAPDYGSGQENYILDAIRADLVRVLNQGEIEEGGLRVFTTFDPLLQDIAEKRLEEGLLSVEKESGYQGQSRANYEKKTSQVQEVMDTPYLQGAVMIMDNDTGAILAMVGGRDHRRSRFNRALQARRQAGSTLKPFVYAAAFSRGLLPGTLVLDDRLTPDDFFDGNRWSPNNADGSFAGWLTAESSLMRSRNTSSVRIGEFAGRDYVAQTLERLQLGRPPMPTSPQIYLGNHGVTLRQLTNAFMVFPNQGKGRRSFLVEQIEDRKGNVLYRSGVLEYDALPREAAWVTSRTLEKAMSPGGTGAAARSLGFRSKSGGKTGTTNDYHDAWFLGYTDRITCGVWIGFDRPRSIISRGYGGRLALPVWTAIMKDAEAMGYVVDRPHEDPALQQVTLCRVSGLRASERCAAQGQSYADTLPPALIPHSACVHDSNMGPHAHAAPDLPSEAIPQERAPAMPKRRTVLDRIRGLFR